MIKYEWTISLSDDTATPSQFWAIYRFEGSKIASETLHADEAMSALLDRVFTPELLAKPGVGQFVVRDQSAVSV